MPNKCSVTGCYTNFRDGPKNSVFKFPADPVLSRKWLKFLNRVDYEISRVAMGMGMGMKFSPVGIPTGFLWEWDGNGN